LEGNADLPRAARNTSTKSESDEETSRERSRSGDEDPSTSRLYERLKSMRQSVFSHPDDGNDKEDLFADMPPMEPEKKSPTLAEKTKPSAEETEPDRTPSSILASESDQSSKRAASPAEETAPTEATPPQTVSREPEPPAPRNIAEKQTDAQSIETTPQTLTTQQQQAPKQLSTEPQTVKTSRPSSEPTHLPDSREINGPSLAKDNASSEPTSKNSPRKAHPLRNEGRPEKVADTRSRDTRELLVTRESPILRVATMGPRQIIIGHESAYQVKVQNDSPVAAEDVTLRIDLPVWTDIQGAEVSIGATNVTPADQSNHTFFWKIGRLQGKEEELLVLHLIPRQSKPFDLKVEWDFRQSTSQAMIEVQEPKIEMFLEGPDEVLWGQEEVYRLHVKNSGTGMAESVELALAPIGSDDKLAATHTLEALGAGDEKVLEVAVTPRESGFLVINVQAKAPHGLESKTTKKVMVRRPELVVSVDAPPIEFVGSQLTYQIHVRNVGNAPATNVEIVAGIPLIAKYIANSDNGRILPTKNQIIWQKNTLDPSSEKTFTLTCELKREGSSALEVTSTADCGLRATAQAEVSVQAIADLSLDVTDPSGAVAVGKDAEYLLTVTNRGTKGAEDIEIVAFFSRGIEPVHAEGGMCNITDGQVVFEKIPVLSAGQTITYKIRARADQPGNHKFRAELICTTLDTHLMGEETTHFYAATPSTKPPAKIASRQNGDSENTEKEQPQGGTNQNLGGQEPSQTPSPNQPQPRTLPSQSSSGEPTSTLPSRNPQPLESGTSSGGAANSPNRSNRSAIQPDRPVPFQTLGAPPSHQ
jgi:uncharacterized repeat protein (TIGR01451 family)